MEDKSIREIKKNIDVLLGSVESHECDPLQDCEECDGSGDCHECDGHGEVDCHDCDGSGKCEHCHGHGRDRCDDCHGNGRCTHCHGNGSNRCTECGGSGTCRKCGGRGEVRCKKCGGDGIVTRGTFGEILDSPRTCSNCGGSGWAKCPDCSGLFGSSGSGKCKKCDGSGEIKCKKCSGSGNCSKCGGSGELVCKKCNGSGKCQTCSGSGKLTCKHCSGSGKCPECRGTGKVTCKRCQGSGWYQTFIKSETTLYAKDWTYVSKNPINEAIGKSAGKTVFDGMYMKWKSANQIEFDKTVETRNLCKDYLGEFADKVDEYVSAYDANQDVKTPARPNDKPYSRRLTAEAIPVTKIEYTTNGEDYVIYLSGDNHVVSYDRVPTEIKAYSHTLFERIKLSLTEKKRMKQYAMLAAYVFQCDGKSKEESRMLNLILSELKLSTSAEEKFKAKLDTFNSEMPYDVFRKHIKGLFSTKKALSFAWQCMAVDKTLSDEEQTLFHNLCGEYQLDENEIETLKNYAKRFARIKDENIVAEYCDKTEKSKSLRTRLYAACGLFLLTIGIIVAALVWPKSESKADKAKQNMSEVSAPQKADNLSESKDDLVMDIEPEVVDDLSDTTETQEGNSGGIMPASMVVLLYSEPDANNKLQILKSYGYSSCGSDDYSSFWTKNCKYSISNGEPSSTTNESSIISISKNEKRVTLTFFNKNAFDEIRQQLKIAGYEKADEYYSSSRNKFEQYKHSQNIYPNVTLSDESSDSNMPYNLTIE